MSAPETTLFPVASLPACASSCGPLFDVNGACVPPTNKGANADAQKSCFCKDSRLAAFNTGSTGVCDAACAADPNGLGKIQSWYKDFCDGAADGGNGNTASSSSSTSTATSGAGAGKKQGGGGGTWLDNHYQWVIFLVIMVVAIVGIWIGACVWRRRYIRKKDRQFALGTNLAHATESGRVVPNASSAGSIHVPASGMFDPAPISSAGVYGEKPQKKRWNPRGRT